MSMAGRCMAARTASGMFVGPGMFSNSRPLATLMGASSPCAGSTSGSDHRASRAGERQFDRTARAAGSRGRCDRNAGMPTPGPDPRRIEQAAARFARDPFARSMGVAIAALDHDRATLRLPYRAEHMNAVGVLNGGASASLLLMAGALAAWTGV